MSTSHLSCSVISLGAGSTTATSQRYHSGTAGAENTIEGNDKLPLLQSTDWLDVLNPDGSIEGYMMVETSFKYCNYMQLSYNTCTVVIVWSSFQDRPFLAMATT